MRGAQISSVYLPLRAILVDCGCCDGFYKAVRPEILLHAVNYPTDYFDGGWTLDIDRGGYSLTITNMTVFFV